MILIFKMVASTHFEVAAVYKNSPCKTRSIFHKQQQLQSLTRYYQTIDDITKDKLNIYLSVYMEVRSITLDFCTKNVTC